ncbi:heparan-alpha-glucosaminide N-acetyltransferase [Parabacteroides sp. PF5-5]|uniref:DUF5009 domain-containing protein n=1 Tax=unclassified Parabacteroides TaxID=2649774 RepID=UPI002473A21B|nr:MULTISPECIES: DUF5009 domain-containing protein [unclassified Parabacteroides]MDH6306506.1 heparan-alpha-glucosaminide N-acetyltransferase [Parabacteroides sp. PH5-39]MDH6317473.1 heparan-alpha-glucosaminide N-acetyltransferase [Parabacteroides sp. PF5-13]MDH6321224.1 heparan-alpha-glucosaminide N-acetyltransferase [Parabacteroides sp. PH5-13]MDH6324956.1 heparan-alpha-glucosaminide N-acetyltransferase [Parabacteroides sp. PH5-8]MDH6328665.1 heparan-alpha-glucosaminide N-acetyltransferase [
METKKTIRIEALDIFRALTMFFMLFVNDISGMKEIPHWLLHATREEDMLGFSDTIFPAFLFAMGMAIPYAIQNRIKKGDTMWNICKHIFWRTLALVLMGVFTVNRDSLDAEATGMLYPIFSILMVIGFFLIWSVYPKADDWKKYLFIGMKVVGIILLAYLFYIFEGRGGSSFAARWWGILGLIGWTYLLSSVIYLFTRENLLYNGLVFGVLMLFSILSAAGVFAGWSILGYIPASATLYAFAMAGLCGGLILQQYASITEPKRFYLIMCSIGVVMLIAAIVSHQFWIISKLQSTPTWLFYCCAIFFPLFALVYWLTDIKKKSHWFDVIKPAGTVTLTCYIIPYALYSILTLLPIDYPQWMFTGATGLIKAIVFSFLVIGIAWGLMKAKIRLKV